MPFDSAPDAEVTARDRMIRLRDHIAYEVPDAEFNMKDWECGTVACIGGWADRLDGFGGFSHRTLRETRRSLGLSARQACDLFFMENSPDELSMYEVTRAGAVAVLDQYLATGLIDWSVASRLASGSEGG